MRRYRTIFAFLLGWAVLSIGGLADSFVQNNGNNYEGTLSDYNAEGIIVRLKSGRFTERIHWVTLNQETLRRLSSNPRIENFTFPFIDIPPDEISKVREISLNESPIANRPQSRVRLSQAMTTPAGLFILGAFMLANLYLAYEIAGYKRRPVAIVCAVSAILPIVAPIGFLFMPEEELIEEEYDEAPPVATDAQEPVSTAVSGVKSKLGISGGGGDETPTGGAGGFDGQSWERGETEFTRRFFETKLEPFFRVVPPTEVKDLVIAIKAGRQEVVGKRITRISPNEIHLQPQVGGEKAFKFKQIDYVKIRHKNAKA